MGRPAFTTSRRALACTNPPPSPEQRAIRAARVLPAGLTLDQYAGGDYQPVHSWAQTPASFTIERRRDTAEIVCTFSGPGSKRTLEKRFEFSAGGELNVSYRWDTGLG